MRFAWLLLVALGSAACDPFGLWDEDRAPEPDEPFIAEVSVVSPADGLDGLMDHARADGAPCAATDEDCVHVGRVRSFAIADVSSCDGVTIEDTLGWMTWTCAAPALGGDVVARGVLRTDTLLADLVDVDALALRTNHVTVERDGDAIARSPSAVWWSTSVARAEGVLDDEDTVYVAGDDSAPMSFDGSSTRVGVVVRPGEALHGAAGQDALHIDAPIAFVWLEGAFAGGDITITLRAASWALLRHVSTTSEGAPVDGFFVGGANLTFEDVRAIDAAVGFRISDARNVRIDGLRSARASGSGMLVDNVDGLVAHDVVISATGSSAIYLDGGGAHRWRGVLLVGQSYGVSGGNGIVDVSFADVTTVGTEVSAFDLSALTALSVAGWLSINDLVGIRINDGAGSNGVRVTDAAFAGTEFPTSLNAGTPGEYVVDGAQVVLDDASAVVGPVGDAIADAGDGTRFERGERAFAKADALTPGAAGRGACVSGCVVIDFALTKASALIEARAQDDAGNLRTAADGGAFLERAREVDGDADGLCEDGETCAATPNIGAYQGHGGLGAPEHRALLGLDVKIAQPTQNGF